MINEKIFLKRVSLFFIIMLFGLTSINTVFSADIFVDSSYNLDNLQNEINVMTNGETLSFDNGQFEIEGLEISKSINIIGSSNTKISNNGTTGTGTGILINDNSVNVSSLTISGFEYGINNYGNDVKIFNNTLDSNTYGITNNETNGVNITKNIFSNNLFYGLNNYLSNDTVIFNNTVFGSFIGIGTSGNNVILKNNIAQDNDGGFFILMSDNTLIQENEIKNNDEAGITISLFCFNTVIENNNIYSNDNCGILISADYYDMISDTQVIANNIYNNSVGISIESELNSMLTDTTILSNNIYNNDVGISIESDTTSTITNTILNYNRILNKGNEIETNELINADYNWWGSQPDLSKIIGVTPNNYFIMDINNLTSLNSNGTVKFHYSLKLSDNGVFDPTQLPYFVTTVYTSLTSGVIKSFDGRFDNTFDIVLNENGSVTYLFVTDKKNQNINGVITLAKIVNSSTTNLIPGKTVSSLNVSLNVAKGYGYIVGQTVTVSWTSKGIANLNQIATLSFIENGKVWYVATVMLSYGSYKHKFTKSHKTLKIVLSFNGDNSTYSSSANVSTFVDSNKSRRTFIEIKNMSNLTVAKKGKINIIVRDYKGNIIKKGKITLKFDNNWLFTVNIVNGVATFSHIYLKDGNNRTLKISYIKNGNNRASSKNTNILVNK